MQFKNSTVNHSNFTLQYAYVLVAHLAEHFWYFLYSPEACTILNDLYRLVEHELVLVCTNTTASTSARSKYSNNIAMTGWARAVAVFVYHAKHTVLGANLNIVHGIGAFLFIIFIIYDPNKMMNFTAIALFALPESAKFCRTLTSS